MTNSAWNSVRLTENRTFFWRLPLAPHFNMPTPTPAPRMWCSHRLSNQSSKIFQVILKLRATLLFLLKSLQKWHFFTISTINSFCTLCKEGCCWGVNVQKRTNSSLRALLLKLDLLWKGAGGGGEALARSKIGSFRFLPFIDPPSPSSPTYPSSFPWTS